MFYKGLTELIFYLERTFKPFRNYTFSRPRLLVKANLM